MPSSMIAAQICATMLDQAEASAIVLAESQKESFPYTIHAFGLDIVVRPDVFSPKHFHGWEVFTRNFPSVKGEDVLEVGSGTGVTAIYLANNGAKKVLAVDISPQAVNNTQENIERNGVRNIEAWISDVYSSVGSDRRFHTIYWNLPFIFVPGSYIYRSLLERGLFDPDYRYTERFLAKGRQHLHSGGRIIAGLADFADLDRFIELADRHGYVVQLLASERSMEINPVEFQLYELRQKRKVFYAMPFTGRAYGEIVGFRQTLHQMAGQRGLDLLEQFVGVEKEDKFESHGYLPLYIAKKDHHLLRHADIVLVDYSGHSIGRDCELVVAKEVMDKRVIAIVTDPHMRNHPYVRLYSNYLVSCTEEAFDLAHDLSAFPLSQQVSGLTRAQKDQIDSQIEEVVAEKGTCAIAPFIPTELKRRWQILFGKECEAIVSWSFRKEAKTVRVNSLRSSAADFVRICERYAWTCEPVESLAGIYRFPPAVPAMRFGETQELANGSFYVQDLASMLPAIVLDPQPGERVLDLGAAPGSKTTQMAAMMGNNGRIVAIDVSQARIEVLKAAVNRLGVSIVEPRVQDATNLGGEYHERFDKVLVDGPCSCEGILRYKPHKMFEWDLLQIYRLAEGLEKMLQSGFDALKPGATLVYSTCTYAPEENEAIVNALLRHNSSAELVEIDLSSVRLRKGLIGWEHGDYDERLRAAVRIYPQDNDTIGFFIAKIQKS